MPQGGPGLVHDVESLTPRVRTLVPWAPDLVEAYLRAGRGGDARNALAVLGRRAADAGSTTAAVAHARCRGLVEDDFDEGFATALRLDDERPMPFERARTLLAYGRRLHRARRRPSCALPAAARTSPAAARGPRDHAVPLHHRSPRRSGASRPPSSPGHRTARWPAELFLSPKTIEFHLGQIYRKLGVHSRTQLAAALRDAPGGGQT